MHRYGLIGRSLVHSFSMAYFTEKFKKAGITDCSYGLFELGSIHELSDLLKKVPELEGLNVTIPYKEQILPLIDKLSAEAKEIGAVNCVKITAGGLAGYNTDAFGFHQSVKPFLEPRHERALILGTGGASKAVAYVLRKLGVDLLFVSRTPHGEQEVSYEELTPYHILYHKLIINTTPLGTYPGIEQFPPIPYEAIGKDHLVNDLVYNPAETAFLRKAREQGAVTLNGYSMLKEQAEKSWDIWTRDQD